MPNEVLRRTILVGDGSWAQAFAFGGGVAVVLAAVRGALGLRRLRRDPQVFTRESPLRGLGLQHPRPSGSGLIVRSSINHATASAGAVRRVSARDQV